MILHPGEKIHVVHCRFLEMKTPQHFIGTVDYCEGGLVRVTGHVFRWERQSHSFVRVPQKRTRILSLVSGDLVVNLIPNHVDLNAVEYQDRRDSIRVTDGKEWQLDIDEDCAA